MASANRIIKQNIQGILLLNKPLGISSNGALQRAKRLFQAKKAGHTGSLDPLATGMLPICFGEATKFSQYLLDSDKRYYVAMKLGVKTATGDAEGEVISTRPVVDITKQKIEEASQQFLGSIQQVPPMYSALKHQGKPLYELARKGIEIERAPRDVQIYELIFEELIGDTIKFEVHCSKGTYVRTLVEDIGEALGCGAHVIELHRAAVTPYQNLKMYTLDELEEVYSTSGFDGLRELLLPVESSVQVLPAVNLSQSAAYYIRLGQAVQIPQSRLSGSVRVFAEDGSFIGIGEMMEDGRVTPRRLVVTEKLVSL